MIDSMQAVVDRVVRLRDGRSLGYAQYGSRDGVPIVNAHGGLACRLDVAAADRARSVRRTARDGPGADPDVAAEAVARGAVVSDEAVRGGCRTAGVSPSGA